MNHNDHVNLLKGGIPDPPEGTWADLGSGRGAFTLALTDLLGPDGIIYSIDKDAAALHEQGRILQEIFPERIINRMHADFTHPLHLPPLDGVVMANSLHFFRHKGSVLRRVWRLLRPGGRLIVVEYNVDRGNYWVPYPISYSKLNRLMDENGFSGTRLLATRPSSFLKEFYSAISFKEEAAQVSEFSEIGESGSVVKRDSASTSRAGCAPHG
jgi:ubiquinone/menaquinone biosynthesis C-methylase UbiE